jgi:decaprenyl-phosphate phosphoribosyltransferase
VLEQPAVSPALSLTDLGSLASALARTARPKQWIKNALVFAAPGAAGVLFHQRVLGSAGAACVVFCLAASATYFVNDVIDVEADRVHPRKSQRPMPAGALSLRVGLVAGVVLMALAETAAFAVSGGRLAAIVAVYLTVTVSYSLWLKHEPIIELAAVASGFVLRTLAGGVATGVHISQWFLIVASFGSLFMVAGKRSAEHAELGDAGETHRSTLGRYSPDYLRYVCSLTSGMTLAAYCLWAFEKAGTASRGTWFELSIIPFVLAILHYALLIDSGKGGAPEELALRDRTLQVLAVLWMAAFAAGAYVR